jgi:hypothetical protein
MKRIIRIIVSLAVGGYLVNSYIENKAKRKSERAETKRIEQATKLAVTQLVSRTGAVV